MNPFAALKNFSPFQFTSFRISHRPLTSLHCAIHIHNSLHLLLESEWPFTCLSVTLFTSSYTSTVFPSSSVSWLAILESAPMKDVSWPLLRHPLLAKGSYYAVSSPSWWQHMCSAQTVIQGDTKNGNFWKTQQKLKKSKKKNYWQKLNHYMVACSAECDGVAFCRACNTHRVTQKNGNFWNA